MKDNSKELKVTDLIKFIINNYVIVLLFTLLGLVGSFAYSYLFYEPQYEANGVLIVSVSPQLEVTTAVYDLAQSQEVAQLALQRLANADITLLNGEALTASRIKSGVRVTVTTASTHIRVTYTSPDPILTDEVLNAVMDASVTKSTDYAILAANVLRVGEYAAVTNPVGISRLEMLAIGTGGVLTLVVFGLVFYALLNNKIIFGSDISRLDVPNYYIPESMGRDRSKSDLVTRIHGEIEISFLNKAINVIGFTPISRKSSNDRLLVQLAEFYASSGLSTLVVDLDAQNNKFTTTLFSAPPQVIASLEDISSKDEEHNLTLYQPKLSKVDLELLNKNVINDVVAKAKYNFNYVLLRLPPTNENLVYALLAPHLDVTIIKATKRISKIKHIEVAIAKGREHGQVFVLLSGNDRLIDFTKKTA